jgi:hypothetical protein
MRGCILSVNSRKPPCNCGPGPKLATESGSMLAAALARSGRGKERLSRSNARKLVHGEPVRAASVRNQFIRVAEASFFTGTGPSPCPLGSWIFDGEGLETGSAESATFNS